MVKLLRPGRSLLVLTIAWLGLHMSTANAQKSVKQQAKEGKITVDLLTIQRQSLTARADLAPDLQGIDGLPQVARKNGAVAIEAIVVDGQEASVLLAQLQSLGLTEGLYEKRIVTGYLPVDKLGELKTLPALRFAQPVYLPMYYTGSVNSQGDRALKADLARQLYNVTGSGSKIGFLSESYNAKNGVAAGVASGDLPPNVQVLDDYIVAAASDEGRAMIEVAYDIAPGAAMAFNTAFRGQVGFAKGIRDLAAAGCNIIVDDVIYFAEPFFQDGIIAQAIDEVKATNNVAYFSAAGNNARNSYQHAYTEAPFDGPLTNDRYLGAHDFSNGDTYQTVVVPARTSIRVGLQWDEPFASVSGGSGARTDLDLLVYRNGVFQASLSGYTNNLGGDPLELVSLTNGTASAVSFELVIGRYAGPAPSLIKWVAFTNGLGMLAEYDTESSTCVGHANAAGAITVGAAYYQNTPVFNNALTTARVDPISSAGGTPILFNTVGQRIATIIRQKPEITAVGSTNTTFFGTDLDNDGWPNFIGTSAAAPHAAAVAALMQQTNANTLTPDQIVSILKQTALDMDDPATPGFDVGFDYGTGYGFIQADKAVLASNTPPTVANAIANQTSTVGQPYAYTVPSTTFTDVETPHLLTLSVKGLPPGLDFTAPATISGTPTTIIGSPFSVTVIATDPGNLSATTTFTFTINPTTPIIANLAPSSTSVCTGQVVSITASLGNVENGYTYSLSDGHARISGEATGNTFTQSIRLLDNGLRRFTLVITSNGLSARAVTNVTGTPPPTASLSNNGPLSCTQTSVTLRASGGSSYTFTGGSEPIGTPGSASTVQVNSPGTYSVTVANANGCVSSATTLVGSTTASVAVSNPAVTSATQGTAFNQAFTASGGQGSYSFLVATGSLPSGLILSSSGVVYGTPTQSGSFSITVRATDAAGCSAVSTVYGLMVSNLTPTLTGLAASPTTVCVGSIVSVTATVGNFTGAYSYTLSQGNLSLTGSSASSAFSQTLTMGASGTQTVNLTVSAASQSTSTTTSVVVNSPPTANLSNDGPLSCDKPRVVLTATGGDSYQFESGLTTSGASATVTTAGVYSVTVSANGCSGVASTTVTDATQPVAITQQPTNLSLTASQNARFSVSASGTGLTYQWQLDAGSGFTNLANDATYGGVRSATLSVANTTTALNGYVYRVVLTSGVCSATSNGAVLTVNPVAQPDLAMQLYSLPTLVYGTTPVSLVVDVTEIQGAPTSGLITIKIGEDAVLTLTLPTNGDMVGGRPVNNRVWTLSGPMNGFYTLTTNESIAAGDMLSVGLTGVLKPGTTRGSLSITAVLVGGSGGEVRIDNNSDADKIDYFNK